MNPKIIFNNLVRKYPLAFDNSTSTPLSFLKRAFNEENLQKIVEKTNLYWDSVNCCIRVPWMRDLDFVGMYVDEVTEFLNGLIIK